MSPVFVCFISTQSTLLGTRVPTDRMPTDVKTLDINYVAHSQIVFHKGPSSKETPPELGFPNFPSKRKSLKRKDPTHMTRCLYAGYAPTKSVFLSQICGTSAYDYGFYQYWKLRICCLVLAHKA
jgi:hypothetical protein